MNRLLAFFLAALVLLQTLGREVLVLDYELNKARITELYCVNKARPQLKCNGKCHLAQQMERTDANEKKAPTGAVSKVKYEVLPAAALALSPPRRWPLPARCYPAPPVAACPLALGTGVFRPPLPLA